MKLPQWNDVEFWSSLLAILIVGSVKALGWLNSSSWVIHQLWPINR
jgi:hypothetical protein